MKEWIDKYNSFNSMKGLLYSEWYKSVKEGIFKPPIEASLDPIHNCNLMCDFCNAYKYLHENKMYRIPDDHLIELVRFLGKWGVLAICFGGGGEPTLHTKLSDAISESSKYGMENSIATNGTVFTDRLVDIMSYHCRWVGVSIDAGTKETYIKMRQKDLFDRGISNIKRLSKKIDINKTNCDVAFKFLITDKNQYEIYEACKIAKETGCRDFHARPADLSHQGCKDNIQFEDYNFEKIEEQFAKCRELENKTFRVFTVVHKFDKNFMPKKNFTQCYAAPLCIQLCANGSCYLCPDQRHQGMYKLGEHYPDPENILKFWGGEKHKKLVFEKGANYCKTRCTFGQYNEQCERFFINEDDPMCWKFI